MQEHVPELVRQCIPFHPRFMPQLLFIGDRRHRDFARIRARGIGANASRRLFAVPSSSREISSLPFSSWPFIESR